MRSDILLDEPRGRHGSPLRDGVLWFFAGSMSLNGIGLLIHLVASRNLSAVGYGELSAILGVLVVVQVPLLALEVAIARRLRRQPKAAQSVRRLVGRSLVAAGGLLVVSVPGAHLGARLLGIDRSRPILAMMAVIVLWTVGLVPRSFVLATGRRRTSTLGFAISAVGRLVISPYLIASGAGVTRALLAIAATEGVAAVLLMAATHPGLRRGQGGVRLRLSDMPASTSAFLGMWAMLSLDTILAHRSLPPAAAGWYVASATAARAFVFAPCIACLPWLLRLGDATAPASRRIKSFHHGLLLVGGLAGVAGAGLAFGWSTLLAVIFGEAIHGTDTTMLLLVLGAWCAAISSVLVVFLLASMSPVTMAFWLGIPIVGVAALLVTTPVAMALVVALGSAGVLVLLGLATRRALMRSPEIDLTDDQHLGRASELDITIVVPFFNPGDRFAPNMERLVEVLDSEGVSYEVIAVSDGSTDASETTVGHLEQVRCVLLPRNRGKGGALRAGFEQARGAYVGFIDADGDIDPVILRSFLSLARLYEPDIITASKRHPMSEVVYPPIRRLYSIGFQLLVRCSFRINVRDTQTGVKLVRREVLADVLPRMVEKRFAFDLELFAVAHHLGYRRFFEAPVRIGERYTSTVSWRSVHRTLQDSAAIFYRLRVIRYYDVLDDEALQRDGAWAPAGEHGAGRLGCRSMRSRKADAGDEVAVAENRG